MTSLTGLTPILATPFYGDGSLDLASLARLVEFQFDSGARAVATFGLASEAFALSEGDRALVLDTVKRTTRALLPDAPVVAGVLATGLHPAIEQGRRAVEGGADILMVLPPFLVKPTFSQLVDFFGELGEALQIPIIVQDAPALTNVTMSVQLLTALGRLPWIRYVKVEAAPTAIKVSEIVSSAAGTGLQVLGGQNAQFLIDEFDRGAIGTMPACDFTDLIAEILADRDAEGFVDSSMRFTQVLPALIYGLQAGISWAVHKHVLVRRGIIDNVKVRAPARPLDTASYNGLLRVLEPFEVRPSWHVTKGALSKGSPKGRPEQSERENHGQ